MVGWLKIWNNLTIFSCTEQAATSKWCFAQQLHKTWEEEEKNFSALEQMKQKIETNFLQHFQGEKLRPEKTLLVKIFCIFKTLCLSFLWLKKMNEDFLTGSSIWVWFLGFRFNKNGRKRNKPWVSYFWGHDSEKCICYSRRKRDFRLRIMVKRFVTFSE